MQSTSTVLMPLGKTRIHLFSFPTMGNIIGQTGHFSLCGASRTTLKSTSSPCQHDMN